MAADVEAIQVDLLQPEILSKTELCNLLKSRNVTANSKEVGVLEKHELVELFYKHVLPLPQRQYKKNRRGKKMVEKQRIVDLKRKRPSSVTDTATGKKRKMEHAGTRLLTSFNLGERLKPPPSAINFERKTISLSGKKSTDAADRLKPPPSLTKATDSKKMASKSPAVNTDHIDKEMQRISLVRNKTAKTDTKIGEKTLTVVNPRLKSPIDLNSNHNIVNNSVTRTTIKLKRDKKLDHSLTQGTDGSSLQGNSESCSVHNKLVTEQSLSKDKKSLNAACNTEIEDASPEEVVRKKFKKTAISWP